MVSGPNLNETSIVSGGYGGTAEGIIPTSSIKGIHLLFFLSLFPSHRHTHFLSHTPCCSKCLVVLFNRQDGETLDWM